MSIKGYINKYNDIYSVSARLIDMNLKSYEKIVNESSHSKRVSDLCRQTGVAMELPVIDTNILSISGLFHDIGKKTIAKSILDKKEPLTQKEWAEIKRHTVIGYKIINSSKNIKRIDKYVLYHHERYDGKGYPTGLKGEDIPLFSRIIAIADSYDAMTNYRTYRETLSKEMAIEQLLINKGKQFDPDIVDIFVNKVL